MNVEGYPAFCKEEKRISQAHSFEENGGTFSCDI